MITLIERPHFRRNTDPDFDTKMMRYLFSHAEIKDDHVIVNLRHIDSIVGVNCNSFCNDVLEEVQARLHVPFNSFLVLDISEKIQDSEIHGTRYLLSLITHHFHRVENEVPYFYAKFKILNKKEVRYKLVSE